MTFHEKLILELMRDAGYQVSVEIRGPRSVAVTARDGRGGLWHVVHQSQLEALTEMARILAFKNNGVKC